MDSTAQIEGEREPNLEPLTTEKLHDIEENPHVEPMNINEPDPTGLRQSTRTIIPSRKAQGLLYDEVETNIAYYLTEFNAFYSIDVSDPVVVTARMAYFLPRFAHLQQLCYLSQAQCPWTLP